MALDHSCQVQRHPLSDRGHDLYETPAVAVKALLNVEKDRVPHCLWEPFAGKGAIVRVLRDAGHAVIASDLIDYGFPLDFIADFLEMTTAPAGTEAILTNAPFRYAARCTAKALELCPRVYMLMRLAFYEAGELNNKRLDRHLRALVLDGGKLARIHVFRLRLPMMHRDQWAGKKANSGMAFAWFCWDADHVGPTTIDRIDWKLPAAGEPEQSPIINKEVIMTTRNIKDVQTEKTEAPAPDESNESGTAKSELAAQLPINVGNPASAASLAIDQSHLEEFAIAEEKSPDVRYGKPPKGVYFTVLPETGTVVAEWKNRAFYYLLEIEGRDPLIVAQDIAKQKIAEGEDVIRPILIVRYTTMAGEEGLWPLKLDKPNAKSNHFNKSALTVLEEAGKSWVRLISAKDHYRHTVSPKTLKQTPPKFSDRTYQNLIDLEFKDRDVRSLDHEIWDVLDQGSDK